MKIDNLVVSICCSALLSAASTLANAQSSPDALSPESAALALYQAELSAANPDGTIPNRYIVTLSDAVPRLDELGLERQVQVLLGRAGGGEVLSLYSTLLYGFAARLSPEQAALLKASPLVASMEPDQLTKLDATPVQDNPPNWGLDRIDQADNTLDKKYYYPSAGEGVHVFIVDSGIRSTHQDFKGRMQTGKSTITGVTSTEDCNGHGTHVAGTAVGATYGVAKKALVYPVRTNGCAGEGSATTMFDGLEWVTKQVYYNAKKPAVVNMSLGVTDNAGNPIRNKTIEAGVRKMVETFNISVVVAAGNKSVDACNGAPGAAPKVLTVAATDKNDKRASFSNYGSCVDLFAPGTDIDSASYRSDTGSANLQGTSMAAPHVTGAMAIWRGAFPTSTAETVQNSLLENHTTLGKVTDLKGSPNRLLRILADKPPTPAFTVKCTILNVGKTCTFDASGSKDEDHYARISAIASYSWDFGDGTTGSGVTATHTYPNSLSQYEAKLTVTDSAGQASTSSSSVLVVGILP